MHPGEYCDSRGDAHPFRLTNVQLYSQTIALDIRLSSNATLLAATHVVLTFTTQKNSVRGEKIGQSRSDHPVACPVLAAARRIIHIRSRTTSPTTPLHTYYTSSSPSRVQSTQITTCIRAAARSIGAPLGILPHQVDCRSCCPRGAMALLLVRVDKDTAQLIARWKSDMMLHYLRAQAAPIQQKLARAMHLATHYSMNPSDAPTIITQAGALPPP